MSLGRFICQSAAAAVAWYGLVWLGCRVMWPELQPRELNWGYGAGCVIATAGWSLTTRGLNRDPQTFTGYFVAGVLLKLVLFGIVGLSVRGSQVLAVNTFLAMLVIGFGVNFFTQLVVVVRVATKLIAAAPTGRGDPEVEDKGRRDGER